MIILGIVTGLCTIFNIWYNVHLDKKYKANGELMNLLISHGIWGVLVMTLVLTIAEQDKPKAIDVYRGNTELEIHSINDIPQDTVVVWKGNKQK
jgi:hypothetical protein